jgi:hypothetical protein
VRRFFVSLTITLLVLLAWGASARAANDPALVWHTLETPHFRITYYSGEAQIAQHIADLGEEINARLEPVLGWKASQRTEIVLMDQTDSANGSATAVPYDAITLYVTAPNDNSALGDVDDWYQELVTHEYTHILHTDHIGGIPAVINAVLGKTYAPNQAQAKWILEGLAVFMESEHTSGGRLRSSQWNMYMRADVLEGNVAPLDVFSNTPRRWPEGNIYYVYGSFFMQWVIETYGEGALRRMIDDYGSTLVPYGVNRAVKRATGRTFEDMYPSFVDTLRREFNVQVEAIRARGLREGMRVTTGGYTAEHPRWVPSNAWKGHAGDLMYYRDDADDRVGFYTLPVVRDATGRVTDVKEKPRELMIRMNGDGSASFTPDGGVVFSQTEVTDNLFDYNDLSRLPAGEISANGLEGRRTRLTSGFRAVDPDVSPDGRRVVFATNHRGTTYLEIADLGPGGVTNTRTLVPSGLFDQAFTPRWSPDNRHVAYSSWSRGGYRDVRIVDTRDGSFESVTQDRALDQDPSYSADGKTLYFTSDRTGVMNVYAYDVATHGLQQVTNVINGAYYPEASPDGKTLAYVGYTAKGFDLFVMPLDPGRFLPALPYENYRSDPPPVPAHHDYPVRAYNPLATLFPRAYTGTVGPGDFGYEATVSATGTDISGRHNVSISITSELQNPSLQPNLTYSYGGLPVDLNFHVYRTITPGVGYSLNGGTTSIPFVQDQAGFESGASYTLPRAFDSQTFSATYSFERTSSSPLAFVANQVDPYATPSIPGNGYVGIAHFGWSYSNAEQYLWSVSPERGFSASFGVDVSDGILGSQFNGFDATANVTSYFKMPWLKHHVVALNVSGGTSGGGFPGQGEYYVGGFQDLNVIDTLRNQTSQGGIVLRGYPVVEETGPNFALINAEYRFPIVNIDRGVSTYPIFLNRFYGTAFTDFGSAFALPSTADFKIGSGMELRTDFTIGFIEAFTFRLGYAHGWSTDGLDKVYFISAVQF